MDRMVTSSTGSGPSPPLSDSNTVNVGHLQTIPGSLMTLQLPLTSNCDALPDITTASLPTARQRQIARQSWDEVSSRQPIGIKGKKPDAETLIDFAATILEMRLADVEKHRRDVELSSRSHASSLSSDDGGLIDGEKMGCALDEHYDRKLNPVNNSCNESKLNRDHCSDEGSDVQPPIILLSSTCRYQIRAYVRRIASMYHDNRYHGMEHAVHVTMSANKLLDMLHEGAVESDDDPLRKKNIPPNTVAQTDGVSEQQPASSDAQHSSIRTSSILDRKKLDTGKPNRSRKDMLTTSYRPSGPSALKGSPDDSDSRPRPKRYKRSSSSLYYCDSFTKFAFVFAAVIHDVDHQGVPNSRLVIENDPIAKLYDGISVAEKNSIKIAFRTLNESDFSEFRSVVFKSMDEQLHMHRIVANLVISTDIASPERMHCTKMRWEEAFSHSPAPHGPLPFGRLSLAGQSPSSEIATVTASEPRLVQVQNPALQNYSDMTAIGSICEEQPRPSLKRVLQLNGGQTVEYFSSSKRDESKIALRQSVVIETMLNAADVAHSMQSWELFLFWNRKLFEELYVAYKAGRSDHDPADGWYENCGVFGEWGGEFLKNAISIRDQWSREGAQVTKEMIASVQKDF